MPLTRARLDAVVEQNATRRLAFSEDGTRIRASQGHSVPVDLGLVPVPAPDVLFHGTAERTVDAQRMQADGFPFFRSENGVWLTGAVPAVYLGVASGGRTAR